MKVCQSLRDKLVTLAEAYGVTVDEIWRQVLFEIPDEALEQFHLMAQAADIEVTTETEELTEAIAQDFGMTVMGMSVLMDKLMAKVLKVRNKMDDYLKEVGNASDHI